MSMKNVPWADDEELRNERPRLRPDLPFGQSPPPPDMQAPMDRGFSGDMSQLQANADANANPQLGSPLSSWKESPLVARARELREKAVIAESIGDQAMARTQKRPIGVTDKMYRQLESNAKKDANPSYEPPISGKGGMEFSKGEGGDGLVRDNPFAEPTDAELEKRMGEGPKAKDVAKWDEEYGGHAAAAKPKKAEGGKPRKDHMADVAAALARLKASKKGTKDEDPRSYGPWADNYDVGDPHPYVTSDARAKREAYELGKQHGAQDAGDMPTSGVHVAGGDPERPMTGVHVAGGDPPVAAGPADRKLYKSDGSVVSLGDREGRHRYNADGEVTRQPDGAVGTPPIDLGPAPPTREESKAEWAAELQRVKGKRLGDLTRADLPPNGVMLQRTGEIAKNMMGGPMYQPIMARLRGKK